MKHSNKSLAWSCAALLSWWRLYHHFRYLSTNKIAFVIFSCNVGNWTRLRTSGQTRACEQYAKHVWTSCSKMSQDELTYHQIFPASTIRALCRFLWLILLCVVSLSSFIFFLRAFYSLSSSFDLSLPRAVSFLARWNLNAFLWRTSKPFKRHITTSPHRWCSSGEKRFVDLSVGNSRCILDLPQAGLCLISFERCERENRSWKHWKGLLI